MKQFMDADFLLSTQTAKRLYHDYAENMPIIDYHCHLVPKEIAENKPFRNVTQLFLGGDHYKWRFMASMGVDETMCGIYAGEGTQYRAFADAGVAAFAPNEALVRTLDGEATTWWLRTKTLEFGEGFWLVGTDGTPLNGLGEDARVVEDPEFAPDELWGPDHARGVVVGFCL